MLSNSFTHVFMYSLFGIGKVELSLFHLLLHQPEKRLVIFLKYHRQLTLEMTNFDEEHSTSQEFRNLTEGSGSLVICYFGIKSLKFMTLTFNLGSGYNFHSCQNL